MSDDPSKPGDGYQVGYRHPPLATRFRPGTSGNPRGRPKGARNRIGEKFLVRLEADANADGGAAATQLLQKCHAPNWSVGPGVGS